jgi:hypothetical protein
VRTSLTVAVIVLSSLVETLALVTQPAAATPVRPVGMGPSCAQRLTAHITDSDGAARVLACDPADVDVLVPGSDIDLHTLDDPRRP